MLRWAAPAMFLAGLTIAVLLIRAGLNGSTTTTAATTPSIPAATQTPTTTPTTTRSGTTTPAGEGDFYTVQSGDTFESIASKNGTTVSELERLNPGVSSNSLSVGQRIRVK